MITEDDLKRLEALITDDVWTVVPCMTDGGMGLWDIHTSEGVFGMYHLKEDAEAIVTARNAIPALIKELCFVRMERDYFERGMDGAYERLKLVEKRRDKWREKAELADAEIRRLRATIETDNEIIKSRVDEIKQLRLRIAELERQNESLMKLDGGYVIKDDLDHDYDDLS